VDRRRFLVTSLASALAVPLAVEAQPAGKVWRIAFLGSTSPSGYASQTTAFREGLRELGYVEGRNVIIEFRWANGKYERLPELAADLVRLKPDVLVIHGVPGALAAKRATDTIPIVIGVVGEAVAIGAVEGLARPGGNVTGSSFFVTSRRPRGHEWDHDQSEGCGPLCRSRAGAVHIVPILGRAK
jgi:putative tryptophan/tyrosine transport system substrate-binding protein